MGIPRFRSGLFAGICGGIPASRVRYVTPIIQVRYLRFALFSKCSRIHIWILNALL
jgi:hypothetical protein